MNTEFNLELEEELEELEGINGIELISSESDLFDVLMGRCPSGQPY